MLADGLPAGVVKRLQAAARHPRLELERVVASPCTTEKFAKLERVQRTSRFVVALRDQSYEDRLQLTGLFSEEYRYARGDVICVRRIIRTEL